MQEKLSPLPPQSMPKNKGEGKTVFVNDLLWQHLEAEGDALLRSLKDLNSRLRFGEKKKIRSNCGCMAAKLGCHFKEIFCPERMERKWVQLC